MIRTGQSKFTERAFLHFIVLVTTLSLSAFGCARVESAKPTGAQVMGTKKYEKPSDTELKTRLSRLEYEVTQHDATEPAFQNRFWDHHASGLYVDVASGEPLFSSRDKFDSGTGWPSFTRPVEDARVVERTDSAHGMTRTEVRSKAGNSHLGHVFPDGPKSGPGATGLRYCINSASLRFIPAADLEKEGYGTYRSVVAGNGGDGVTGEGTRHASHDNACAAPPPGAQPGCAATLETAILAGGCFWGMEEILRKVPGIVETSVGYTGGTTSNPTYEDVKSGRTGHAEAIRITFDPKKISYAEILEKWFFRMHDPTTKNRQGNDVGTQYRSAIFVANADQRRIADEVRAKVDKSGKWGSPIVTEITDAGPFTLAESYRQDYLEKHPGGYTCHFLRE